MFYVLWSLKEAFVKAVGQGLGFNLLEVGCYS
jgi:phosphopantetheinyl transferase